MKTEYSNFSSLEEFLTHTQGSSRREILRLADVEISNLRVLNESRQGVRSKNMNLIDYGWELFELYTYLSKGKFHSIRAATYPEFSELRKTLEEKRKELERNGDWLTQTTP